MAKAAGSTIFLLALLATTLSTHAQNVDLKSELVALVNSEIAFSKAAADSGIRAAFLAFLAGQSVVFRPGPVDGRALYSNIPASQGGLSWYPVVADISRTADLGYTTGPYESRSGAPGAAIQHGYYASLWSRQKDGTWKVVLDTGAPNAAPETRPAPWQPPATYNPPPALPGRDIEPQRQREALMEMDRQCVKISRSKSTAEAYAAFLDDSARLYGFHISAPFAGKPAVLASQAVKAAVNWQPMNAVVSRGDDLGCTYGQLENGGKALSGYYTHFWKRDAAGAWKIVLEVLSPAGRKN